MMLRIEGLKKTYGNYHALDGLDMEVKKGSLYGFVGPNGAGKTTTIKIMAGLICPDCGTREALESIDVDQTEQEEILAIIHRTRRGL